MNLLLICAEGSSSYLIILNCLAQDFSFLKQQIKLFGKIFNSKIILNLNIKKKW